jgi:hypothetical protein
LALVLLTGVEHTGIGVAAERAAHPAHLRFLRLARWPRAWTIV